MPTKIVHVDTLPLIISDSVNERITEGWSTLQLRDPRVFNGGLLRVIGTPNKDTTTVSVSPDIGYREVVGLRSYKDFLDWVPESEQFQVLSAIAFVETSDGAILLRDRSTGDWEYSLELLGGFVTAENTPSTVEDYISGRVVEDLSMPLEVISSVERVGYVDFKSICEGMFVFKVVLNISFENLEQAHIKFFRIPEGYTAEKHQSFFQIPLHMPSRVVLENYLGAVLVG